MGEHAAACGVGASLFARSRGVKCEGLQEIGVAIPVILHVALLTLHVAKGKLGRATKDETEKNDKISFKHFYDNIQNH